VTTDCLGDRLCDEAGLLLFLLVGLRDGEWVTILAVDVGFFVIIGAVTVIGGFGLISLVVAVAGRIRTCCCGITTGELGRAGSGV